MFNLLFQITMPSGAHVIARTSSTYMNLEVYPHPRDKGKMWGLCGNYDGDSTNDDLPINGQCQQYV